MNIGSWGAARIGLAGLVAISLLGSAAGAQSPPGQSSRRPSMNPAGVWRGTSVCLVRPSACNDEIVVYRIARTNAADTLTVDARKIVRGQEEEMGVLTCRFTPRDGLLSCPIPRGTWQFRVRGDSLLGELRLSDDTKFRDVRTARAP
jgi:hypothetical protein